MPLHAAQGLSLIRMAFGLYFVVSAFRKTTMGWLTSSEPLTSFVGRNLEASTPPYGDFLATAVLPNADRFAQLVVFGEWVAGVSLLGRPVHSPRRVGRHLANGELHAGKGSPELRRLAGSPVSCELRSVRADSRRARLGC